MLSHMPRLDAEVKMFLTYVFRRLCLQPVTGSDNIFFFFFSFFFFEILFFFLVFYFFNFKTFNSYMRSQT